MLQIQNDFLRYKILEMFPRFPMFPCMSQTTSYVPMHVHEDFLRFKSLGNVNIGNSVISSGWYFNLSLARTTLSCLYLIHDFAQLKFSVTLRQYLTTVLIKMLLINHSIISGVVCAVYDRL